MDYECNVYTLVCSTIPKNYISFKLPKSVQCNGLQCYLTVTTLHQWILCISFTVKNKLYEIAEWLVGHAIVISLGHAWHIAILWCCSDTDNWKLLIMRNIANATSLCIETLFSLYGGGGACILELSVFYFIICLFK